MSANERHHIRARLTALRTVTAVVLIDSDGNRLFAKYYQPAHQDSKAPPMFRHPFQTLKEQRAFESGIWEKTRRATGPSWMTQAE